MQEASRDTLGPSTALVWFFTIYHRSTVSPQSTCSTEASKIDTYCLQHMQHLQYGHLPDSVTWDPVSPHAVQLSALQFHGSLRTGLWSAPSPSMVDTQVSTPQFLSVPVAAVWQAEQSIVHPVGITWSSIQPKGSKLMFLILYTAVYS